MPTASPLIEFARSTRNDRRTPEGKDGPVRTPRTRESNAHDEIPRHAVAVNDEEALGRRPARLAHEVRRQHARRRSVVAWQHTHREQNHSRVSRQTPVPNTLGDGTQAYACVRLPHAHSTTGTLRSKKRQVAVRSGLTVHVWEREVILGVLDVWVNRDAVQLVGLCKGVRRTLADHLRLRHEVYTKQSGVALDSRRGRRERKK